MNIRSVTAFTTLNHDEPEMGLAQAANFLHSATAAFEEAGFTVQTRRMASQPFPLLLAPAGPGQVAVFAGEVQELAGSYGIDFLALGPVRPGDDPGYVDAIPDMIAATESLFCAIEIAEMVHGIDAGHVRRAAQIIQRLSTVSPDGFGNLYLASIANCPPGGPFFPSAYHAPGETMRFALALQAADVALAAFDGANSVADAARRLTQAVEAVAGELAAVASRLAEEFDITFGGIDFSLAPYPGDGCSLGGALERLGATLGGGGASAAAAVIMSGLDAARFPRCGFSGLMLPVLEDSLLAERAASGQLTVTDLLLYSTICGTGLDTVPLPGAISEDALAGILLDVAALALRLDKPLTARLMPIPGKAAGEDCGIRDFAYFAPGRVMAAPIGLTAGGLLGQDETFRIRPRGRSSGRE
jgi:uncharacterized protein (UPF0210 family)